MLCDYFVDDMARWGEQGRLPPAIFLAVNNNLLEDFLENFLFCQIYN